jgi:hypothetical protein
MKQLFKGALPSECVQQNAVNLMLVSMVSLRHPHKKTANSKW